LSFETPFAKSSVKVAALSTNVAAFACAGDAAPRKAAPAKARHAVSNNGFLFMIFAPFFENYYLVWPEAKRNLNKRISTPLPA
jgi:hypothetical protein